MYMEYQSRDDESAIMQYLFVPVDHVDLEIISKHDSVTFSRFYSRIPCVNELASVNEHTHGVLPYIFQVDITMNSKDIKIKKKYEIHA